MPHYKFDFSPYITTYDDPIYSPNTNMGSSQTLTVEFDADDWAEAKGKITSVFSSIAGATVSLSDPPEF